MFKKIFPCLAILIAMMLLPSAALAMDPYHISPGDTVDVRVADHPDISSVQQVDHDGTISLMMLGRVNVEGLTAQDAEKFLRNKLAKYIRKPQVAATITPKPIYVVQHDLSTNLWEVRQASTIAEAQAYTGNQYFADEIKHGDVLEVERGRRPNWAGNNWFNVISSAAILVSIFAR